MPQTPETWLPQTTLASTSNGPDTNAQVTQLANGNILVVWEASVSGVYNIWGRIYDPFGNEVSGQLSLDGTSSNVREPSVTALPDGGFIVAFEQNTSGSWNDISLARYTADGTLVTIEQAYEDPSIGGVLPGGFKPEIAASSGTSVLTVWHLLNASDTGVIVGRLWNADTQSFSRPAFSILAPGGTGYTFPDVDITVLANGNYAIVANRTDASTGQSGLYMRILASDGSNVLQFTQVGDTVADSDFDFDPSITALAGGGYVIAWTNLDTNDTDILFQIFDANGSPDSGVLNGSYNGLSDTDNEPVVVALADGGYLIVYDDEGADDITVLRYGASGLRVGVEVNIAVGEAARQPDAVLLADGRVAITYTVGNDVQMEILDMRDDASQGDLAGDSFDYMAGTVGDDTFTPVNPAGEGAVHGWDGDDDITESGTARTYNGGDGNDTLRVTSAIDSDRHEGGDGIDLIDWSGAAFLSATTFDLWLGTASDGSDTEVMAQFEQIIGTGASDTIFGLLNASDTLMGANGNDTLDGRSGADSLDGGVGNDVIEGGDGNDTITGGGGNDSVLAGTGQDSVLGGDGNDTLWGNGSNDTVIGNAGNDFLHGGDQNDLVQGGDGDDTVGGGNGADTVEGGAGNDEVNGGASADLLRGNDGNDTLLANTGEDTLFGGTGDDDVNGGDQNDTVYGNQGSDTVNGGFGNDAVYGGDDNDTVFGGFGNDGLFGGSGDDLQAAGAGTDTLYGNTGNDTLFGGDDNDLLYGNAGEDLLGGGNGADTLIGGEDSDRLIGDGGADVFRFLAVTDTAVGAGDVIADFAQGTDVIDVAAIDALVSTGVDDAFTFLGTAAHTGAGATLRYSNVAGNTYIYGDVDADAAGDFVIVLEGTYTLAASDFVL